MQDAARRRKQSQSNKSKADSNTYKSEPLESRRLLTAIVASPDQITYGNTVTGPLAPKPGHSYYVSGLDAQGNGISQWAGASAITPNTVNDLVLNVSPAVTNYTPCCESAGGTLGANLLTNGITQSQTAPAGTGFSAATGDGGANDPSNNLNVVAGIAGTTPTFTYNLGAAPGQTPSSSGYDLSEIDVITGHQDYSTQIFTIDVLVEPAGSTQFYSLSGGQGFSMTAVPDASGHAVVVGKGAAQMAIVPVNTSTAQLDSNIRAVKLIVRDPTTFFREFVVTGVPSPTREGMPLPTNIVADTSNGSPVIQWSGDTRATGYTIFRSTTANGTYAAVGTTVGQQSFIDSSAQPNSAYFYEVQGLSPNGQTFTSAPSPMVVTGNYGATAYVYQQQFWQGTPTLTENLPSINYSGGNRTNAFPLGQGINGNAFSMFATGKITTDLAGSYTFVTNSDDDGYLYVNGQLVSASPGAHVASSPTATRPITLAANTSYNFVLLENQQSGLYAINLAWQEPQGDTSPGPLTVIPANHLSPTPTAAPVPQQVTASVLSTNSIQVNWNSTGDTSSYGYVIERAWSDTSGNPTTAFEVVGQVFSGPAASAATGAPTWGRTSFVDTTALANTQYIYKVGVLMPGQTVPTTLSAATSVVALPPVDTVSLHSGVLTITAGHADDGLGLYVVNGNQIVVAEGATTGDISAITIFSAPLASVNSLYVSGISSGYQSFNFTRDLNLPGSITITQMSDILVYGSLSASQIALVASGNINIFATSVNAAGPITLDADANNDSVGMLMVSAGTTINSSGNPISIHSAGLALSGSINAGAGDVLYSVWPLTGIASVLTNTTASGTVTIAQTNTAAASISGSTGPGITGSLVLDFSTSAFSTTGLNTTAGNANLQILASSIFATGPINTGNGALTIAATNATLGAAVTASSVTIPVYAHVAIDGATMLVTGNINNAGSLTVGAGGVINCAGAITGNGTTNSGLPVGSGTVAYYRLEGAAGTAPSTAGSIIDSSGNGLNGTPFNGPTYSSSVPATTVPNTGTPDGSSLSFDGSSQGVAIPDNAAFQLTKSMTLEAYIYALPAVVSGEGQIIFRGDDRPGTDPFILNRGHVAPNTLTFAISTESGRVAELDAPLPLNQWIHVAGTLDDATGQMMLYINGAVVASTVTTVRPFGVLTGPNPEVGIGNLGRPSGGEPFSGSIDEVRISNVALTPSQFLNAPLRPAVSSLTAGSIAQTSINVGPAGAVTLPHAAPVKVNTTTSLNVATGGKFDLANNTLLINYGAQLDPVSTIRSYLASGLNGGAWNGTGIFSSDAAGNASHNTAIGYADSAAGVVVLPANTLELKYTLYGDTGLAGTVGFTDFMRLTQHYGTPTNATWLTGDFNYDGAVDASDFNLLQPNYSQTLPAPAPAQTPIVTPSRPARVTVLAPPAAPLVPVETAPVLAASVIDLTTTNKAKKPSTKAKHPKKHR